MRTIEDRRKDFMKHLINIMDLLDPSGENSKLYENRFGKMSDKEFDKFIRAFFKNEKANLYLEIIEFEREENSTNEQIYANGNPYSCYVHVPYNAEQVDADNSDAPHTNSRTIDHSNNCDSGYYT